jgi:hypothetical protein
MNWMTDLKNGATVGLAATFAARTTNAAGSSVDLGGAELQHAGVLVAGALTDGTHNVKLQESTDGSNSWTDVTDGAFSALAGNTTNQHAVVQTINFRRSKRYVRATATVSTATSGGVYGVLIVAQKKVTGATPQTT